MVHFITILFVLCLTTYLSNTADICGNDLKQCCTNDTSLYDLDCSVDKWFHSSASRRMFYEPMDPLQVHELSFDANGYRITLWNVRIHGLVNERHSFLHYMPQHRWSEFQDHEVSIDTDFSEITHLESGNTYYENNPIHIVFKNVKTNANRYASDDSICFGSTLLEVTPTAVQVEGGSGQVHEAIQTLSQLCFKINSYTRHSHITLLILHFNWDTHTTNHNAFTKSINQEPIEENEDYRWKKQPKDVERDIKSPTYHNTEKNKSTENANKEDNNNYTSWEKQQGHLQKNIKSLTQHTKDNESAENENEENYDNDTSWEKQQGDLQRNTRSPTKHNTIENKSADTSNKQNNNSNIMTPQSRLDEQLNNNNGINKSTENANKEDNNNDTSWEKQQGHLQKNIKSPTQHTKENESAENENEENNDNDTSWEKQQGDLQKNIKSPTQYTKENESAENENEENNDNDTSWEKQQGDLQRNTRSPTKHNTIENKSADTSNKENNKSNIITPQSRLDEQLNINNGTKININDINIVNKNIKKMMNPKHNRTTTTHTKTFSSTYTRDKNGKVNINRNSNSNTNINEGGEGTSSSQGTSSSKSKIMSDGNKTRSFNENDNTDNNRNIFYD